MNENNFGFHTLIIHVKWKKIIKELLLWITKKVIIKIPNKVIIIIGQKPTTGEETVKRDKRKKK